jgi:hypothetical protein
MQVERGARVLQAYLAGYAAHVGVHVAGRVYSALGDGAQLEVPPHSVLGLLGEYPPLVVYHSTVEVVDTSAEAGLEAERGLADMGAEWWAAEGTGRAAPATAPARGVRTIRFMRDVSAIDSRWLNEAHRVDISGLVAPPAPSASASAAPNAPKPRTAAPPPPPVPRANTVTAFHSRSALPLPAATLRDDDEEEGDVFEWKRAPKRQKRKKKRGVPL